MIIYVMLALGLAAIAFGVWYTVQLRSSDFASASGGEEEAREVYEVGYPQAPLDGCPENLMRIGGFCIKDCPPNYVEGMHKPPEAQEIKNMCLHKEFKKTQTIKGKISRAEQWEKNDEVGNSEHRKAEVAKIPEYKQQLADIMASLEESQTPAFLEMQFGPQPKDGVGCGEGYKWQSGMCAYNCPQGYDPRGIVCKKIDQSKPGDILSTRKLDKGVGEHCAKGYTYHPDDGLCIQTCKPGYEYLGGKCYPLIK